VPFGLGFAWDSSTLKGFDMIQPSDFTKIKHDINGNPRHVCHFLHLDMHGYQSNIGLSERYTIALALAKTLGGRKYHNKKYGGGIVFQEYDGCLPHLCDKINALTNKQEVEA
jgi:hypothetical protein